MIADRLGFWSQWSLPVAKEHPVSSWSRGWALRPSDVIVVQNHAVVAGRVSGAVGLSGVPLAARLRLGVRHWSRWNVPIAEPVDTAGCTHGIDHLDDNARPTWS